MVEDCEPPKSAEDLLRRHAAGERDFSRANLDKEDFEGANLSGAVLSGAVLSRAVLCNANLSGADLEGANLYATNLIGTNLLKANLRGANLGDASPIGANLYEANLGDAKLINTNLIGANLFKADLRGADLRGANLNGADLRSANLWRADVRGANLRDANLIGVNLNEANLGDANLYKTNLSGANLGGAKLSHTLLLDLNLSPLCDASPPVIHESPSMVDYRAIVKSIHAPNLKDFLQRTGMPEVFIEYMVDCALSLQTDVFKMLQSTFISYGGPDEPFARKLYEALHRNGVTTFFFAEHAEPGKKLHRMMTDGVNAHDRMILVCSRASLDRKGVLNELEKVLEREARDGGASYLIPIRLDDYVFTAWKPSNADLAQAVRDRVVADFEGADTDDAKFNEGLRRLIAALKKPDPPKPGSKA